MTTTETPRPTSELIAQIEALRKNVGNNPSFNMPYNCAINHAVEIARIHQTQAQTVLEEVEAAIAAKWQARKEELQPLHRWLLEEAAQASVQAMRSYVKGEAG